MELFQKAIINDFESLNYEEILEIFPLLYYSVSDIDILMSNLKLTSYQATKIIRLEQTISDYTTKVPFHSILADVAKSQQNKNSGGNNDSDKVSYICNDFDGVNNLEQKFGIVLREISELFDLSDHSNFEMSNSELLCNPAFHQDIKLIICVLIHEKPLLWQISHIVKGLLHCDKGVDLIRSLALNFPHQWHTICYAVIDSVHKIQARSLGSLPALIGTIRQVLDLNPGDVYSVFEYCLTNKLLPELVLRVALDLNDSGQMGLLDFLKLVLLDEGQETCKWFTNYIKLNKESSLLARLNNKFIEVSRSLLSDDGADAEMRPENVVNAQLLLKILAAMKSFANFRYEAELSSLLISIITHKLPVTPAAVQLIQISIAFILSLKSNFYFSGSAARNFEQVITAWFQNLLELQDRYNSALATSYSELLLLIALFYHTKKSEEVVKTVTALLGFRIHDHSIHMFRKMITHDVFMERVLTAQAAKVPVNKALSSRMSGYLPIDCVLQLLNSRSFSRNNVKINNWIMRQLCHSVKPLHRKLMLLISSFVETLFPPVDAKTIAASHQHQLQHNDPINEADIEALLFPRGSSHALMAGCCPGYIGLSIEVVEEEPLVASKRDMTPHILVLYYLLSLQEAYQLRRQECNSMRRTINFFYSPSLWKKVPIRYLLVYAEKNMESYQDLYPALLRLITMNFPQLVCGDFMIQDELQLKNQLLCSAKFTSTVQASEFEQELDRYRASNGRDCFQLLRMGQQLSQDAAEQLVPLAGAVVRCLGVLMQLWPDCECKANCHRLMRMMKLTWIKLHLIMPRRLEVMTVNELQQLSHDETDFLSLLRASQKTRYSEEQILEDPVEILVVNMDRRIYRCPPVLEIVVRVIESVLLHSALFWHNSVQQLMQQQQQQQQLQQQQTQPTSRNPARRHQSQQEQQQAHYGGGGSGTTTGSIHMHLQMPDTQQWSTKRLTEIDQLRRALLKNQAASIIQLLLEQCLPTEDEMKSDAELGTVSEIQRVVGNFVHSMFINDQDLCYIVHWQTYPQRLLPITVRTIPSLHICLDNVEEMFMNCGNYYKMVFLLDLVSHIAMFYNVKKAQDEVTKMLDHFQIVISNLRNRADIANVEERPVIIWHSVDAMVRLATTFPNLLTTVAMHLVTTGTMCHTFVGLRDDSVSVFDTWAHSAVPDDTAFMSLELEQQYRSCYSRVMAAHDSLLQENLTVSSLYQPSR